MERVLFVFWHGLGDNILATPVIKKYKQATGNFVGWGMLRRFQNAKLFDNNPYIDELHWISDAWNDFSSYPEGCKQVLAEAESIKAKYNYDKIIVIKGKGEKHKIYRFASEMEVDLEGEIHTEVYYEEKDLAQYYKKIDLPKNYIFFNGKTGVVKKDLPLSNVEQWLAKNDINLPIVSPDFSWDIEKFPISFAMDVMKNAEMIILADSAMYHAANAMELVIDMAYFARGKSIWNVVYALHAKRENVVYSLKEFMQKSVTKILFLGVFHEKSTSNSQVRSFEKLGVRVIKYDFRAREKQIGCSQRDREIIYICKEKQPQLVLFCKCNEVSIDVVNECNKICKTALWYMDPLNNNYTQALIEKIKACTFTCVALKTPYEESKKYSSNLYFLQEGFDQEVDYPVKIPYKHDVSFIGHLREERITYHKAIKFHNYSSAYGHNHALAVGESRINLNFTKGGTSDRTYKVLAARGFLLTQPWPSMEDDFEVGRDFDVFNSITELKDKIKFYLERPDLRQKFAEQGHKTVQKFNRDNFAKRILEIFEKHNNEENKVMGLGLNEVKDYWDKRSQEQGAKTVGFRNKPIDEQDKNYKRRQDFIIPKIPTDLVTLDYGCGIGRYSNFFNKNLYLGIDICDNLIQIAKKNNPEYSYQLISNPTLEEIKISPELFFTSTVLQHNSDEIVLSIFQFLKQIAGQKIYLALYENTHNAKDQAHIRFRKKQEYIHMINSFFVINKLEVFSHMVHGEEHSLFVVEA